MKIIIKINFLKKLFSVTRSAKDVEKKEPVRAFVNITDRPSIRWTEEQRRTALGLVGREGVIMDLLFPIVDPWWDGNEVWRKAGEIIAALSPELFEKDAKVIFYVQGEVGMTFALVHILQEKGAVVVHSTTSRRVDVKDSVPEFCQFRNYR